MSSKKSRTGHQGFLTGILPDVDTCSKNYNAEKKAELVKWQVTLKEQLDKILPLDREILAELIADEESTEEDVTTEIDRSTRLKADVTQRLVAIDEKLAATNVPYASLYAGSSGSQGQNIVENGSGNGVTSAVNPKPVRVKLPKLEVRKFSGKLEDWQEFWDSFDSAIHSNDSLSNVEKFSYLRGLLLEPARSAIAEFALTSANYESAVELLKKRFGKKIAIQRTLVNELLNTRPVFNDSDTARLQSIEPCRRCRGWKSTSSPTWR